MTRSLCLLALAALPLAAQQRGRTAPLPANRRICDMSIRLVTLRLVDPAGAPVSGAALTVVRRRGAVPVAGAGAMSGQGDYKVLEDGDITDLSASGEWFDAVFRHGARSRNVRLRIGTDSSGCHVKLLSPASAMIRF